MLKLHFSVLACSTSNICVYVFVLYCVGVVVMELGTSLYHSSWKHMFYVGYVGVTWHPLEALWGAIVLIFQINSLLLVSLYIYLTYITERYGCHIANLNHTAIMLNSIWIQHFCIYIPKHNQLHYLLHLVLPNMCLLSWAYMSSMQNIWWPYMEDMHIYVPHMKSLASTMWQGVLLQYTTDQIWLLHCTYSSHSQHAIWLYIPDIFAHIYLNTPNCYSYFTFFCQRCTRNIYSHQTGHISHIVKVFNVYILEVYQNIFHI